MIAVRWGLLCVAALSILAAWAAAAAPVQGSLLRVATTAVFGLLAPLFWPGCAPTMGHTAWRVVAWTASVVAAAAIAIGLLGHGAQAWPRIVSACAILFPIVLLSHAVTARLERRWGDRAGGPDVARELAGRAAALGLALLGTLPFWLGPLAELLATHQPQAINMVVGASPLTHLAVASGNDLLRNSWFYEHSNLAPLPVSYPELASLARGYGAACAALALFAIASRRRRSRLGAFSIDARKERTR